MVVWGIASSQDSEEILVEFVENYGLTYTILLDPDGSVNLTYGMEQAFTSAAYPQDWVIGTDGVIVYSSNSFELDAMVRAIEAELD